MKCLSGNFCHFCIKPNLGFNLAANVQLNCCFCSNYACVCFLHWCVRFHQNSDGTAWELAVCKYVPNRECNGKPKWQQTWMKWVKITLCRGSWFLLYSMLKYDEEKPFVPLKSGLGVGVVAQKQLQQMSPGNLKLSKNSIKPHPIIHIWNTFT